MTSIASPQLLVKFVKDRRVQYSVHESDPFVSKKEKESSATDAEHIHSDLSQRIFSPRKKLDRQSMAAMTTFLRQRQSPPESKFENMKKFGSILKLSKEAENIFYMLHGVFVVYKPPGEHIKQLKQTLKVHFCRDLNKLKVRSPGDHVRIEGATNKQMTVSVGPSYADHPLLVGPRYQIDDIKISFANNPYPDTSGVLVCGINNGRHTIRQLQESKPIKFYKLKGILGRATLNYFVTGKVGEKSTFGHVRREHIDKICASMQSSHQRKMFDLCGLSIQSQAAYELAVQGPIRPAEDKVPIVYSIKCVDFKSPEFTLEIVCMNEDEMFLKELVHSLGLQVRSTATCSQIQCFRYGLFTVEEALLKKHWDLENITHNMAFCRNLLAENKFMKKQRDPILKEYSSIKQIESTETQLKIA